jgi:hypothetical protein
MGTITAMSQQTLGLVGAACLVAGWMLASTARPPVAQTQGGAAGRAVPAAPAMAVPTFDTLHQRLEQAPPAPQPQRNPFAFEPRRPDEPRAAAPAEAGRAPEIDPPAPPVPVAPLLQLVGVAADLTDDGIIRTAILSNGREMWLLKVGGQLPDGRTIVRVEDDAVALADAFGQELVLRLR